MNAPRISGYIVTQADGEQLTFAESDIEGHPAVRLEDSTGNHFWIFAQDWETVKHAIDSLLTPAIEEIAQKETDEFVAALLSATDRAEST